MTIITKIICDGCGKEFKDQNMVSNYHFELFKSGRESLTCWTFPPGKGFCLDCYTEMEDFVLGQMNELYRALNSRIR